MCMLVLIIEAIGAHIFGNIEDKLKIDDHPLCYPLGWIQKTTKQWSNTCLKIIKDAIILKNNGK